MAIQRVKETMEQHHNSLDCLLSVAVVLVLLIVMRQRWRGLVVPVGGLGLPPALQTRRVVE